MKRFRKIYLEISNICNLKCHFCPGTKRPLRRMSEEQMAKILPKLFPYTDYLYFHLMGEPLGHPELKRFLQMAKETGFKVILTTNGTLLSKKQEMLLDPLALPHKVNISLHAFEANDLAISFEDYLREALAFGKAAEGKMIVVYRLWNQGGEDDKNDAILSKMKEVFSKEWVKEKHGIRIGEKIYVEHGDKFEWPDLSAEVQSHAEKEKTFCYGLRDQMGILCDGSVVPCCLDHEGDILLGNIFEDDLETILSSERATRIYQGFLQGKAPEELCRRCGYAGRFSK